MGNDLICKEEKCDEDEEDPINGSCPTATVGVPWIIWVKRGLFGKHKKLYIISPYTSPMTTPDDSERCSRSSSGDL